MLSLKWTDVAPYVILLDIWPSTVNTVVPLNYYNSLPTHLRKIIDDAAVEADTQMTATVDRINDKALQSLKAKYKDFDRYLEIIKKDNIAL